MVSKKKSLRMEKKRGKKNKKKNLEGASTAITVNAPTIYNASSTISVSLSLSHLGALTGQIPGERVKRMVERKEKKSVIIMGNLVEFFDPRPSWCSHFIPPTNFFM